MSSLEVNFRLVKERGLVSSDPDMEEIVIKEPSADNRRMYSPTQFLLFGMAGCTSGDVISILGKMRQTYTGFRVKVKAEREEEHPKVVKWADIHFMFDGDLDKDKVRKAINLSLTKYCSVSILAIRGGTDLRYSLTINGQEIDKEKKPDPSLA